MTIGPYRLLERVGEGGMGEVWHAEQRTPVRRRVALKLIKAGMDTREVVRRFESERQALALMDHPAIAKVFDAGSTAEGRPYFVMEYVAGLPITSYCDRHTLSIRDRLELFVRVCEAVEHAHRKAIIHRDLKPSNILVSEVDGTAMPRIIDFGIAKATAPRLTAETLVTRQGVVVGTPAYMSPEQADSGGEDVDTRTDVYSLGVMLYELLVGTLPLTYSELGFSDVVRKLRDEDAPRPSTKFRTLGQQTGAVAKNRAAEPATLARELRGDLDAIALKALEKDRRRRYGSPTELAADITRYLRHEPIAARPADMRYRTGKYVRRHRVGVATAAGLILLLMSFATIEAVQLRRITRERDVARQDRDRADRVTAFMTQMFDMSDPTAARGNQVTVREVLDKASTDIRSTLAKDPELQARMMHTMGKVYRNLGLFPASQALLEEAAAIRRRVLGGEDTDTLDSVAWAAMVSVYRGNVTDGERVLTETVATLRRTAGVESPITLTAMAHLGNAMVWRRRFAEAEALLSETVAVSRRVQGPEHRATMSAMDSLAVAQMQQGRTTEAEKVLRELLDLAHRTAGPDNFVALRPMTTLALTLMSQQRYAEAETLLHRAVAISRRMGPDHLNTMNAMETLGNVYKFQRKYREAEDVLLRVLETRQRVLGAGHQSVGSNLYNLACVAALRERRDQALGRLREALATLPPQVAAGIATDPDFTSLHGDPGFSAIVASVGPSAPIVRH